MRVAASSGVMSPWAQAPSTVRPWLAGVSGTGRVKGSPTLLSAGKVRSRMSFAAWIGLNPLSWTGNSRNCLSLGCH